MQRPVAHYREVGSGPSVLCIHSIASSGAQWRPLMELLAGSYRVVAVDLYGDGKSPTCPAERDFSIDDEVELIQPILEEAGRFHLVGHSYGASVAIKICLSDPSRVASLVLYEPTLWGMFVDYWPDDPGAKEVLGLRAETGGLIDSGDIEAAAHRFVDYWSGLGVWAATPEHRRADIIAGVRTGAHKWKPNPGFSVSPEELNALDIPNLVLTGSKTAEAMRGLMKRLREAVPRLQIVELAGLGHMGPITHPEIVNARIAAFLQNIE